MGMQYSFIVLELLNQAVLILIIQKSTLTCLNIGTLKNMNFPLGANRKPLVLGVLVLSHFRVDKIKPSDNVQNFFLCWVVYYA